jgi:capsular exopolysaccharide synthesis family protein
MTPRPKTRTNPTKQASKSPSSSLGGKSIDPVRILRQNFWILGSAFAASLFLGVLIYFIAGRFMPLYQGKVVFELNSELSTADDVLSSDSRNADTVTRLAKTEMSRILSPVVMTGALQNRDLRSTEWASQFFVSGAFDMTDALVELEDTLFVSHPRDTNTFQAAWSGSKRADVPIVLDAVTDSYVNALNMIEDDRFQGNLKMFTNQRDELEFEIGSLETERQNFVRENNITSLNEAVNERNKRSETLNNEITDTRTSAKLVSSRISQLQAKLAGQLDPSNDEIRMAEQEPSLRVLKQGIQDIRIALGTQRSRLSDNHPAVSRLQRRLESAEDEYAASLNEIIQRNLNADYKEAMDQQSSMESLLTSLESDYVEVTQSLRDYASALGELTSLERRLDNAMQERDDLNRTIGDLNQLRVRADASKVRVMQPATLPKERSFPKLQTVVPATVIVVVGFIAGLIFLLEFMDNRLRYPSDFASIPDGRLLGILPDAQDDPTGIQSVDMVVRDEPDSILSETYRQCASRITREMDGAGHKSLLVMSGMPESGTTTVIVNVASSIQATGRKVVLIDTNFRRPRLESAANVELSRQGLGDVLAGEAPIEAVITENVDSFDLIGPGSELNRVFERLNTQQFDDTLSRLSELYDVVILDGPPGVVSGDALMLASKCDCTILVVRSGAEERGLVSRLIGQLRQMDASFIGIIFNRPRNTAGGYFKKNFKTMAGYTAKD